MQSAEGYAKFGFEMPRERSGCCMWRSSTTPSMCCIVSGKRRRKRAKRISAWPRSVTEIC